jgi:hypothetical protein
LSQVETPPETKASHIHHAGHTPLLSPLLFAPPTPQQSNTYPFLQHLSLSPFLSFLPHLIFLICCLQVADAQHSARRREPWGSRCAGRGAAGAARSRGAPVRGPWGRRSKATQGRRRAGTTPMEAGMGTVPGGQREARFVFFFRDFVTN